MIHPRGKGNGNHEYTNEEATDGANVARVFSLLHVSRQQLLVALWACIAVPADATLGWMTNEKVILTLAGLHTVITVISLWANYIFFSPNKK